MSFNSIKTNLRSEKGFTIVELLIVIVVIGILAAITIVSFNGVTSKANATSAKSAASSAIKKAEAYNAEVGSYPTAPSQLTSATSDKTYQLTGVTFSGATEPTVAPTSAQGTSYIKFFTCTNGFQVAYWDYAASTPAWTPMKTGACTGTPAYVGA